MAYLGPDGSSRTAPLGFVLSPERLVTVRFAALPVFDLFAERFAAQERHPCSVSAFLGLLEGTVDRLADVLEQVGAQLEGMSREVFREEDGAAANASAMDRKLRGTLRGVGRAGERLANIRDSLLGVNRLVGYAMDVADAWVPADLKPRFGRCGRTSRRCPTTTRSWPTRLVPAGQRRWLHQHRAGERHQDTDRGVRGGRAATLLASIMG